MTTNMDTKLAMKTEKKPFCKICFDTKQPESVYTSHYVRDVPGPNGVVVCPTLLQIECRYCKKKGHTNSKCPILKKKQNRKPFSTASTSTAPSLGKKKHKNVFQVLEVDSGDDEEDNDHNNDTTHTNSTDSTAKPYIMALKKPIAATPEPTKVQYKPETPPGPPPGYYASKSWADYSDSDDDDDE